MKLLTFNAIPHTNFPGLSVRSGNRPIKSTVSNKYLNVPGRDGSYMFPGNARDKVKTYIFTLVANSFDELWPVFTEVSAWLHTKSKAQLIVDDQPDRYDMGVVEDEIEPKFEGVMAEFEVQFHCEPYAYSLAPKTQNFVSDSLTITNEGTAPASPKFTATFTATATEYKLWFGNYFIRIVRNFIIGDILVIDNAISKVTVNGVNAMANLDLNSRFFGIDTRTNALNVTPTAKATTVITWKERWL